jgi:hypothetical protein
MVTRPGQVRHSLGWAACNSGFELLEVVGDCRFFFARSQMADCFDFQRESATRQVSTEHVEDRRTGKDSQLGPDCQETVAAAQEQAGARIRTGPGDVAVKIDRKTIAKGGPGLKYALNGNGWRQVAA